MDGVLVAPLSAASVDEFGFQLACFAAHVFLVLLSYCSRTHGWSMAWFVEHDFN
jgi:hypothetical protein